MTIKFIRHVIMGDYCDYEFAIGKKNLIMLDNLHTALKVERLLKRLDYDIARKGFIEKDFIIDKVNKEELRDDSIFHSTTSRGTQD